MARILYVEDNADNVYMLTHRLERRGHQVVSASDGGAGLAAAAREAPDLVLLDLDLPVMDGWEVARRLKADAATRRIPVVALSAHAMPGDRERALAAGCDDHDVKPVDLPRLLGKIDALLGRPE
jgi:CheY-like chemotaxis protein